MSCSRTGTSMCSRSGMSRTVDLEARVSGLQPRRALAIERVEVVADDDHRAGLVAQLDHVALADLVARDRHPAAVDLDVAVAHELAGLGAARSPAGPEHDVVEALLEHPQEVLAGDARSGGWPRRTGCGTASPSARRCGGTSASHGAGSGTPNPGADALGHGRPAGTAGARSDTSSCRTWRPSGTASSARAGRDGRPVRCIEPCSVLLLRPGAAWEGGSRCGGLG